ncbi:MAG TPA: hypothetical protein VGG97_01860 [Bryobacteraceae bacterium]|jgi:hypothetical protein
MYKALIISVLSVAGAFGQATIAIQKGAVQMSDTVAFGPMGITTALAGPMVNVTAAPYSAQATTERVQTLADGNRIVQTTSGSVARDSQGRVRRDESLPDLKLGGGDAPRIVMIDDPVAQVHWTLDAESKRAIKMALPNIKSGPFGVVAGSGIGPTKDFFFASTGGAGGGAVVSSGPVLKNSTTSSDSNVVKIDLGTQTVEGVPAQGTRITRTIPAGQFGNEQPMIITTETWYSPDLKVLVMSKSSDPRMGDTTYTLTNIQRSEPAASLFQVPEDYTVRDAPVMQMQKDE